TFGDDELAGRVAHGSAAVTTPARLMEHQRTVVPEETAEHVRRLLRDVNATCHLEEAELLRGVADQEVLGLLVVLEHLRVGLTSDAGALVPAERGVRGVGVVAVGPHTAGLDGAARAVRGVDVAAPHTGAEAVKGV